jgi:hypothetical protein
MADALKPLWLLDVDGVCNAVDPDHDGQPGWRTERLGGFIIRWRPAVTEFIAWAHNSGRCEVRWLTTWESDADIILAGPLGLPRVGLAGKREHEAPRGWWKFDLVRATVPDDRPLIWTDDDIASAAGEGHNNSSLVPGFRKWLGERSGPKLLVSPDFRYGLDDDALVLIDTFLTDHAESVSNGTGVSRAVTG